MSDDTAETRTRQFMDRGPEVIERPHSHSGKGPRSLDTPEKKLKKERARKTRRREGEKEIEAGQQEERLSPPEPQSTPPPETKLPAYEPPSESQRLPRPLQEEASQTKKAGSFSRGGDRGRYGKE